MHTTSPRRGSRRRRTILLGLAVTLIGVIVPVASPTPAGAATAPLTTTDGLGIRVDENAILGPALEAIEDELQPFVNQKISAGALANSVMDDPDWADGSANVELSFDFVNAGTAGYPQGGLKVHADLTDIRMRFYRYGEWWQPECLIYVEPDDGAIDASAKIDTTKLPNAPLTLNPIDATWDDDPSAAPAPGYSWTCNGYLIDEWWDGLWGEGTDVAAQLEAELNAEAQELVDALWDDHVAPVIDSLEGFGIAFNQVRTDANGLIVTANVNATGGLTLPGLGGPFNVSSAEDAGVTSNVNTLLANRGEVIVSIHPNVVNQFLVALNTFLVGSWAAAYIDGPTIEGILIPPGQRGSYRDEGWYYEHFVSAQPFVKPTGTGGAPQMQVPGSTLVISHEDVGPVATFDGTFATIGLKTAVHPGTVNWGPSFDGTTATATLTRTQAVPDVVTQNPSTAAVLPVVRAAMVKWNADIFETFINLAPISVGGIGVNLCTTCGRYSGDQRYTETFNVG